MIRVEDVRTTTTFWALDQKDTPREVTVTPEFEKLIKSQRDQFGFDRNQPVTIYSDTIDIIFAGAHPHTIDPARIFTTEKGARQSLKDRRKLKALDDGFATLNDQDAFIKKILSTYFDMSELDGESARIMKTWLRQPTKVTEPAEIFAVVSTGVKDGQNRFNVEGTFSTEEAAKVAMDALRKAFSKAAPDTFSIQKMPFGTLTSEGIHHSVDL